MNEQIAIDLAERMGWTLVHSLWQFVVLAALMGIVLKRLHTSSPRIRYLVQCAASLSMVLVAGMTFVLGRVPSAGDIEAVRAPTESRATALVQSNSTAPAAEASPSGDSEDQGAGLQRAAGVAVTHPPLPHRGPLQVFAATVKASVVPWLPKISLAWLLGVAVLSIRPVLGWWNLSRLRTRGTTKAPSHIVESVGRLSQQLGISRMVRVVESTLVEVPTVIGWLRPLILLPASAVTGLSSRQLQAVIAHELAHVRRYDYLVNVFQVFLETVFFYHPAVWWVSYCMRVERENCCDDLAISLTQDRDSYAKSLLWLEENRGHAAGSGLALAATDGSLVDRIRRIAKPQTDRDAGSGLFGAAVMLLAIAATSLWWTAVAEEPNNNPPTDAGSHARGRYNFPDYPHPTSDMDPAAIRLFKSVRERMDTVSGDGVALTAQQASRIRKDLTDIRLRFPDDPIVTYVDRRLVVLDWQTGSIDAQAASRQLKEMSAAQHSSEHNFTLAMALTIDARELDFDSFRRTFASLNATQTPQFGWFAFEWSKHLVGDYPSAVVTEQQALRGQPIAEEYKRKIAVSDWLQHEQLDALERELEHIEREFGARSPAANAKLSSGSNYAEALEVAQLALAFKRTADDIHQSLGGRLYLDVSERVTEVLLPRTLDLWERAVALLDASSSTLESPKHHLSQIQLYRQQLLPHLQALQAAHRRTRGDN